VDACFYLNRRGELPVGMMPMLAAEHAEAMGGEFGEPVDVLGSSTGGSIAQQLAAACPARLRVLVLRCAVAIWRRTSVPFAICARIWARLSARRSSLWRCIVAARRLRAFARSGWRVLLAWSVVGVDDSLRIASSSRVSSEGWR
jgi:pimeloyl-ACP methyl ester carboxylesterase